ncbi:hypothetical protein GcM1_153010 [Golovinomyces cichoracearum]|uniref:Uncharacterized protein n=1 Tax=Golovinomyces cichoracearum TaxID=62708 RepID=A0A420JAK8_9PEZI|nr:hypothetical protein GcM1_153010 [Golovinomyces cichoracearum]
MAGSDNPATQKSSQGSSSRSPHVPKIEGPSLKLGTDHKEKELLEIIESTTVAYRKKVPQILNLEHWNKEAVLNEDSSSVAITLFSVAFVADWDSIPEVYSP